MRRELQSAWMDAASDLGIDVVAPFDLPWLGSRNLIYVALVPGFGEARGTLVIETLDDQRIKAAQSAGYAFSCMGSQLYRRYERTIFRSVLEGWGWRGPEDRRPAWCRTEAEQ
jgi:hypothetical protein